MNYWQECIEEAFCEAAITATPEQIGIVVGSVEGAHENYGMAHGHDCTPNPLAQENERLSRELETERDKVICPVCRGAGTLSSVGPVHSSFSSCWKCRGHGKVSL